MDDAGQRRDTIQPRSQQRVVSSMLDRPLGEVAQSLYDLPDEVLEKALETQNRTGTKLGDVLVEQGALTEEQLAACLSVLVKKETTFLSHAFFSPLRRHWVGRHTQLTLESLGIMLITLLVVDRILGLAESGLIAIFFASAALTTRFNVVLADVDLRNEAIDILAMFVGLLWVFVGVGFVSDLESLNESFGFVMSIADLHSASTIFDRRFGGFNAVFSHNLLVLFSVSLLAFLYRAYAALLILAWNACVWGLTLTLLFRQSFVFDSAEPYRAALIGIIAILPHLVLEATAYIFGAMGAINFSKAILWHSVTDRRFLVRFRGSLTAVTTAIATLLAAAFLESNWAPRLLEMAAQ